MNVTKPPWAASAGLTCSSTTVRTSAATSSVVVSVPSWSGWGWFGFRMTSWPSSWSSTAPARSSTSPAADDDLEAVVVADDVGDGGLGDRLEVEVVAELGSVPVDDLDLQPEVLAVRLGVAQLVDGGQRGIGHGQDLLCRRGGVGRAHDHRLPTTGTFRPCPTPVPPGPSTTWPRSAGRPQALSAVAHAGPARRPRGGLPGLGRRPAGRPCRQRAPLGHRRRGDGRAARPNARWSGRRGSPSRSPTGSTPGSGPSPTRWPRSTTTPRSGTSPPTRTSGGSGPGGRRRRPPSTAGTRSGRSAGPSRSSPVLAADGIDELLEVWGTTILGGRDGIDIGGSVRLVATDAPGGAVDALDRRRRLQRQPERRRRHGRRHGAGLGVRPAPAPVAPPPGRRRRRSPSRATGASSTAGSASACPDRPDRRTGRTAAPAPVACVADDDTMCRHPRPSREGGLSRRGACRRRRTRCAGR